MPKERAMTQLSRPYQIALVALVLLVLVWFVALRHSGGGSASTSPSASTPSAPSAAASSGASAGSSSSSSSAGKPTSVYHGSAPGVEGLTRDIDKAHQAVAESQQNAQQLQSKSAQASGEANSSSTSTAAGSTSTAAGSAGHAAAITASHGASHAPSATASAAGASQSKAKGGSSPGAGAHSEIPAHEARLESELSRGKVAVVLFWNDRASDDQKVHEELQSLSRGDHGIAVQFARSSEVASFGSFTRTAQVVSTPTVLIVNRKRQVTALSGLTDTFALQQAIGDASAGPGRVQAPHFTSWTPTSSRAKFVAEANHLCRSVHGNGTAKYESVSQLRSAIGAATSEVETVFHKVEGLSIPTADRPFIHTQFDLLRKALHHFSAAIAPGLNAADVLQRRTVILEGGAEADQATNSLEAYGLRYCG
jgi:hypothetical protein